MVTIYQLMKSWKLALRIPVSVTVRGLRVDRNAGIVFKIACIHLLSGFIVSDSLNGLYSAYFFCI